MNGKLLGGMKTPLAVRIADKKRAKQINNRIAGKNPELFQKIVAEARFPAMNRTRRGLIHSPVRDPRPRSSGSPVGGAVYPYSIRQTNPNSPPYASPHLLSDHVLRQREHLHYFSDDQMYASVRSGPGSFRQHPHPRGYRQPDISYANDLFVLEKPLRETYTDLNPTAPEFFPKSLLNDPLPVESAVLSALPTSRELSTPSPSRGSAPDVQLPSAPYSAEDLLESFPADTEVLEYSLFGNTTSVPLVGRNKKAVEDSTYPLFANLKSAWPEENKSTRALPDVPPGYSKSPVSADGDDCTGETTEELGSARGLSQGYHAPLRATPLPPGFRSHTRPSAPRLTGRSAMLLVTGLPLHFTDDLLMELVTAHSAVREVRIDFGYPFHPGKMDQGDTQSMQCMRSVPKVWLLTRGRRWSYYCIFSTLY